MTRWVATKYENRKTIFVRNCYSYTQPGYVGLKTYPLTFKLKLPLF